MLAGAVVIVVLLWAFIDRTLIGKAMVATAANRLAARLVGINTRRIVGVSFALSAAIGAVAGILVTPITLTSYDVGTLLALKGFAAAMLGGMGSPLGAVVGGLIARAARSLRAPATSPRNTRTRSPSWSSCWCCSPCRRACSARPRSSGCERACAARSSVWRARAGDGRRWSSRCRWSFPSAYYYRVAALVFVFALAVRRPQSADGLCRAGQPRPCRLLRDRRLCGRGRADASRPAVVAALSLPAPRCPRSLAFVVAGRSCG